MKLQTPEIFIKDLIAAIDDSKESVNIQSMLFESGEILVKLTDSLISAAERGVEVKVVHDWVSQKYVHGELPLISLPFGKKSKYGEKLHKRNVELIKKLLENNILVEEISKPGIFMSLLPFSGRNHMKIYIVDHTCWLGGINLSDESFKKIDFMVRFEDAEFSSEIKEAFDRNFNNENYADYMKRINSIKLLVDGGRKNNSIIYEESYELIKKASTSITFMSQFVPDGKILKELLRKANNGISINVITSSADSDIFKKYPERLSYLNFLSKIKEYSNIRLIHLDRHVHAKLIFIDEKIITFGSHNYVIPGVIFGTKEIAVEVENESLSLQIKEYLKSFVSI